jgi:hypothetical protein
MHEGREETESLERNRVDWTLRSGRPDPPFSVRSSYPRFRVDTGPCDMRVWSGILHNDSRWHDTTVLRRLDDQT